MARFPHMPLPVSRARKSSLPTSVTTGPLRAPERCCRRRDGPKLHCYFPLPGELHPQAPFPPKLPTPKRPPILLELQSMTGVVTDHHGSQNTVAAITHRHPSYLTIDTLDGEPTVLFSLPGELLKTPWCRSHRLCTSSSAGWPPVAAPPLVPGAQ
jgi:hypothetical protein